MVEGYSLVSMLTVLVTLVTCASDGGVLEEDGFRWALPAGATFDRASQAEVGDGVWGPGAEARVWTAKVRDESLWQLTRWTVPKVSKGLTARALLRRWRSNHGCAATMLDGGVTVPSATLQFAHEGSCVGGDVYVRRVAVFSRDGGAVVYEFNAVRFLTLSAPKAPQEPLAQSLDAFVQSVELR